MKNFKRALSLTAALAMTAASVPFVSAEEDISLTPYVFSEADNMADTDISEADAVIYHTATLDDFDCSTIDYDTKEIRIDSYKSKYPNLYIPEAVGGYKVAEIGRQAFSGNTVLRNIKLPSTVETINDSAFLNCPGLLTVQLSEGTKSINSNAFQSCTALKTINLPQSLTDIGVYAFSECESLENITIPSGVKDLSSAFSHCKNLKSVVIEGARTIANYTFWQCSALTTVTFPNTLEEIGESAFEDCTNLKSISLPDSVVSVGKNAFKECNALASAKLPSGLTCIDEGTFYNCKALTSITIPSYVLTIGEDAFFYCDSLKNITISEGVQQIGKNAFIGAAVETLTIPKSVKTIGESAFCLCQKLKTVTINDGVTEIGAFAFSQCYKLKNITLPKTLNTIGEYAFNNCELLETIYIPENTYTIGERAFTWCQNLTSVIFPGYVTKFGDDVFSYSNHVTIYGNENSDAQAYAKANDIPFKDIKSAPAPTPKITKAQGMDGKVALNWTAVDGATNYAVYTYLNGKWSVAGYRTATGMYVTGLTNGTKYGFAVKAYVNGKWSGITSSDIAYATPVGAAASKPRIIKAEGQNGQVALNWTAVSGATNYAVYYTVGGKWYNAGTRTATGMYVRNLTNGTKYGFAVKAYVNGAWTSISSSDIVYATPVGTSAKPVITKAQGQNGRVALNWTSVSGATNYAVYTYLNGKWSVAGYRTATGMYVTGLTNGVKYGFAVKAYVNGAWTNITSADIVYATPTAAKSDLMDTDFDDFSFLEDNGIDFVDIAPTVR